MTVTRRYSHRGKHADAVRPLSRRYPPGGRRRDRPGVWETRSTEGAAVNSRVANGTTCAVPSRIADRALPTTSPYPAACPGGEGYDKDPIPLLEGSERKREGERDMKFDIYVTDDYDSGIIMIMTSKMIHTHL